MKLILLFSRQDRHTSVSERILLDIQNGIHTEVYSSTATIQEIIFWLYNQGLHRETIEAVNALSHLKNIEWVPITPETCLKAAILVERYGLSPFDAYHAATALDRDAFILSTDHAYDRVKNITRIPPEDLVKE
ncbi:type II toxin-antitoxin system VapC family toxin [Candidatus Bathyarchaeota archaeon]|nr:MAG: type II toxin-antitoxin system VapC family toxin [Candidatus Bathyarchaeota archaeon]